MPKSFLLVSPNVSAAPIEPSKRKTHQFSYRSEEQGIFQELKFRQEHVFRKMTSQSLRKLHASQKGNLVEKLPSYGDLNMQRVL